MSAANDRVQADLLSLRHVQSKLSAWEKELEQCALRMREKEKQFVREQDAGVERMEEQLTTISHLLRLPSDDLLNRESEVRHLSNSVARTKQQSVELIEGCDLNGLVELEVMDLLRELERPRISLSLTSGLTKQLDGWIKPLGKTTVSTSYDKQQTATQMRERRTSEQQRM